MTISTGALTTVAFKNGSPIPTCSWQKRNMPRNACGTKWIPADCWGIVAPKRVVVPEKRELAKGKRCSWKGELARFLFANGNLASHGSCIKKKMAKAFVKRQNSMYSLILLRFLVRRGVKSDSEVRCFGYGEICV
jgi:hypothetical protein